MKYSVILHISLCLGPVFVISVIYKPVISVAGCRSLTSCLIFQMSITILQTIVALHICNHIEAKLLSYSLFGKELLFSLK